MRKLSTILFLLSILLLPITSYAQTISTDISIESIPENPTPGSTVILRANAYAVDLSQASISWKYNNVSVANGIGRTEISVIAPKSGATGVVTATASGSGFEAATATIVLHPASADVLWEAADAYTPPFYKGKSMVPPNGLMRFTTIPSITAPKGISYNWSRNTSAMPDVSGYGKASIVLAHSEFNRQEKVEVSTLGGVYTGSGSTTVIPRDPTVVIYQNKGGFIDYANGFLNSILFEQSGMVLHFEPYYFSTTSSILSDLNFGLTIDGEDVDTSRPNEVGLSRPSTGGQSILKLAITPITYSLQHAEKTFTLSF